MASEETISKVMHGYNLAEANALDMMNKGYFSCEPYKGFLDQFKNLGCWFEALVMMTNSPDEVDELEALKLIDAYEYFNEKVCPALRELSENIIEFGKLLEDNNIQN